MAKGGIVKNGMSVSLSLTTPQRQLETGTESMLPWDPSLLVCKGSLHRPPSCSSFGNSSQSLYEISISLLLSLGPIWTLNCKLNLWLFFFLDSDLSLCIYESVFPDVSPPGPPPGPASQRGSSVQTQRIAQVISGLCRSQQTTSNLYLLYLSLLSKPKPCLVLAVIKLCPLSCPGSWGYQVWMLWPWHRVSLVKEAKQVKI